MRRSIDNDKDKGKKWVIKFKKDGYQGICNIESTLDIYFSPINDEERRKIITVVQTGNWKDCPGREVIVTVISTPEASWLKHRLFAFAERIDR